MAADDYHVPAAWPDGMFKMSGCNACRFGQVARRIGILLFLATAGVAAADAARAEGQCDFLSFRRNRIYKDAGYCFKTAAQIRIFGNAGCQFDSQQDVPLSSRQRGEVAAIVREERALGCR